jgi:hypothetical protein
MRLIEAHLFYYQSEDSFGFYRNILYDILLLTTAMKNTKTICNALFFIINLTEEGVRHYIKYIVFV